LTEKIYLEYPYLKELEANIIEKKFINNKYYIKLNKTIFYPHLSGGQPRDNGSINDVEIVDCYEDKTGDIIHVVEHSINGTKVKLMIDWNTRLDHMQQHTGQHILSSVIYKIYNAKTIGFNIHSTHTTIDVELNELKSNDLVNIELLANNIIYSNFSIKKYITTEDNIKNIPVRNSPKVKENIRIVEIEGLDYSPCAGTHLRKTGEVGIVKISGLYKYKGNIRIEFLCGYRALKDYNKKNTYINELAKLISSKDSEILDRVAKLYKQNEILQQDNRELKESYYKLIAEEFLRKSKISFGKKIIIEFLNEMNPKDLYFITNQFDNLENLIQIYFMNNKNKCQFHIKRSDDLDVDLIKIYNLLSKRISIIGGGKANCIQGSCRAEDINIFVEMFLKEVRR